MARHRFWGRGPERAAPVGARETTSVRVGGLLLGAALSVLGCAPKQAVGPTVSSAGVYLGSASGSPDEVGLASWYGKALAGRRTASGERFDPRLATAAHKTLPFGTWVEVRRLDTAKSVVVRINDRGPNGAAKRRIIDLSQRAAEELGFIRAGVTRVELRIVRTPEPRQHYSATQLR